MAASGSATGGHRSLHPDAVLDEAMHIAAADIEPQVTRATPPEMVVSWQMDRVPHIRLMGMLSKLNLGAAPLLYMGSGRGYGAIADIADSVPIGSVDQRTTDPRKPPRSPKAGMLSDRGNPARVVPGSGPVKGQAEQEGLDQMIADAGSNGENPGRSTCLADERRPAGVRKALQNEIGKKF